MEGAAVGARAVAIGADGGAWRRTERNQLQRGHLCARGGAAVGARAVAVGADGGARRRTERNQLQRGHLCVREWASVGARAVAVEAEAGARQSHFKLSAKLQEKKTKTNRSQRKHVPENKPMFLGHPCPGKTNPLILICFNQ